MTQVFSNRHLIKGVVVSLLLAQLASSCFWIFKGRNQPPEMQKIEFTACVFNNSANFNCIQDCVYYAVKHGLEICFCYYRDCAHRARNFSFTVTINALAVQATKHRPPGLMRNNVKRHPALGQQVFEDGDCRPIFTYDPKHPDNINDQRWVNYDPYTKSGELCLNGYPAGGDRKDKRDADDDDEDHEQKMNK